MKPGNLASVVQGKLLVTPPHGNTSSRKCCTSFVNSGDPSPLTPIVGQRNCFTAENVSPRCMGPCVRRDDNIFAPRAIRWHHALPMTKAARQGLRGRIDAKRIK